MILWLENVARDMNLFGSAPSPKIGWLSIDTAAIEIEVK